MSTASVLNLYENMSVLKSVYNVSVIIPIVCTVPLRGAELIMSNMISLSVCFKHRACRQYRAYRHRGPVSGLIDIL